MKTTIQNGNTCTEKRADEPTPRSLPGRWLSFLFCCFIVWVFMFILAPGLKRISTIGRLTAFVEESGIDAGALFYTEVEEAAYAEIGVRSTIEYMPAGP